MSKVTEKSGKDGIDRRENPLRVGLSTLDELEERIKAFRVMNQSAVKKRFVMAREAVFSPDGKIELASKGEEIDVSMVRLMRRYLPGTEVIKTFQPDEGIVIVSDMTASDGIAITMDLSTQLMNLGHGKYETFIDRVDSFSEFLQLLTNSLFPRLLIIGWFPHDRMEMEKINFVRARRFDQHLRCIEVTHKLRKTQPYFPRIKQVQIDPDDPRSWGKLIVETVREYTKPYYVEEI